MQKLIIFTCILFLTGCYEFGSPPFSEDELKPISKLKFGKTTLNAMSGVSVAKGSPIAELKDSIDGGSKAFQVNEEFLIVQEYDETKKTWSLMVLMKSASHILSCVLSENKDIQYPKSLKVTKKEGPSGYIYTINGRKKDLKSFALKLVKTTPLMCMSIPFENKT